MPTPWIVGSHRLTTAVEANLNERLRPLFTSRQPERDRTAVVGVAIPLLALAATPVGDSRGSFRG
jgi:hypothetical protein